MNAKSYAREVLSRLSQQPAVLPTIAIADDRRKNAGRCMVALACNRLAQAGEQPRHLHHTTFEWKEGVFALRNSRISDHFWSALRAPGVDQLHELASHRPVIYLLTHWDVDAAVLHVWAVPENIVFDAFQRLPVGVRGDTKSVEVVLESHLFKNAPGTPTLAPYYLRTELMEAELAKLIEAIKTDDNIKQERLASDNEEAAGGEEDELAGAGGLEDAADEEPVPGLSDSTVAFLLELPEHTEDGAWHEQNKRRYERLLRDPCREIVSQLRDRYIQRLSPAVAGGKRHLSILKKNDYGKGGYHDHFWLAFYDPAAGSKTKSVQLFVIFRGGEREWRYGFSMGDYCDEYLERLKAAISQHRDAVAEYVRQAPAATRIWLSSADGERELSPLEFSERVKTAADIWDDSAGQIIRVDIGREYPLETLPAHSETLVDEVGKYFVWAWPFFDAAMLGKWQSSATPPERPPGEVDEDAPSTIHELEDITALPERFLCDLEDALWAKHQVILVGPPGTSKTFVARQFARYFVRQRPGQPQGSFDVLYMHANWAYEDFFEGIKPNPSGGGLSFESRVGFFLEWVAKLKDFPAKSRHVLVLDEINRCDTAAVLGELLQLLEYRGTTVRLLSGRNFVFPDNVFIIGTMNSADRSIGRLDLALRRRFLWLDLHPQAETLDRWLKRPGNNPLGFKAAALETCNRLLADHGIPSEQQIGHALFMLQGKAEDDEASPKLDIPLSERQLLQVVRFSVLPYVRELLTMQFGQSNSELLEQISKTLLHCVDNPDATLLPGLRDVEPQT